MAEFRDRWDAGRRLAAALGDLRGEQPIVLALPRGGVPVGYEVARALGAPLDVWVVRKVGVPWHPELGMGAVAEGGYLHLSQEIVERVGVAEEEVLDVIEKERAKVEERVRRFRGGRPKPALQGRTVILVDDGIATGGTVRAAIQAVKAELPRKLVLAVPVAPADAVEELGGEVDDLVCLLAPPDLYAIGIWYEDFGQVSDEEVTRLLELSRAEQAAGDEHPIELA
jgi:putative phosphoribosyl transferase